MQFLQLFMSSLATVVALDLVFLRAVPRAGTRWFMLHASVNAIISIVSWPSLAAALFDPMHMVDSRAYPPCLLGPGSKIPLHLVNALHVYHVLAYSLTAEEWSHHVLFVLTLGTTGAWYDWGLLSNYLAFFLCGVPGGIEYAMLVAKRAQRCSESTFRRCSAILNIGIRQPCVLLGLGAGYVAIRLGLYHVPLWAILLHYLLGFFNVCYYTFGSVARSARPV